MPFVRTSYCALSLISSLFLIPEGYAAPPEAAEEVRFYTADQVELCGTFYPSFKRTKGPAVLLLHAIGRKRKDSGWEELARAFQKKGFAVLSFDFRGHGESTSVDKDFWFVPAHKTLRGASSTRQTISVHDFLTPYHHALLVNDIVAARHFLELKSLKQECNSEQILLVGAETGATLGALWLAAEWQRWRLGKDELGRPLKQGPEAQDIVGGVWLSISPALIGQKAVPLEDWLGHPVCKRTPMAFLYGAEDTRSAGLCTALHESMGRGGKESRHPSTVLRAIEGTAQTGVQLLWNGPGDTEQLIIRYAEYVLENHRTVVRIRREPLKVPSLIPIEQFGIH